MQGRQQWLCEYLIESDASPREYIGSLKINADPIEVAADIRHHLGINANWAHEVPTWGDALRALRAAIEEARILPVLNGVVGNNTHRRLDPKKFRGFVLIDEYASFVRSATEGRVREGSRPRVHGPSTSRRNVSLPAAACLAFPTKPISVINTPKKDGPAARMHPRRFAHAGAIANRCFPCGDIAQQDPGCGEVGGAVALAQIAPIDDASEPAVFDQHVLRMQIAVDPVAGMSSGASSARAHSSSTRSIVAAMSLPSRCMRCSTTLPDRKAARRAKR
jgi:hypothetical protein